MQTYSLGEKSPGARLQGCACLMPNIKPWEHLSFSTTYSKSFIGLYISRLSPTPHTCSAEDSEMKKSKEHNNDSPNSYLGSRLSLPEVTAHLRMSVRLVLVSEVIICQRYHVVPISTERSSSFSHIQGKG